MHYTLAAFVPYLHLVLATGLLLVIALGAWTLWRSVHVLFIRREGEVE